MLSIKHFVCCGIDVHKKFVAATIAITDYRSVTSYIKGRFATFNSDLKALKKWLLEHNCTEVCMESTGKYWIPVFNILEDSCHVVVANPKYVRAIKGQKTDDKDSAWIADLFKFDIVPSNYIPCKEILALRELFRYRQKTDWPPQQREKPFPKRPYRLQHSAFFRTHRYFWEISNRHC